MRHENLVVALVLGAFLTFLGATSLWAAEAGGWMMEIAPESEMSVSGSSTVHDWVCKDIQVSGDIRVKEFAPDAPPTLNDLKKHLEEKPGSVAAEVKVPVKQIHCEKDGMDPKTHKALKAKQHPTITYRLTELKVAEPSSAPGDSFSLNTTGELTVAGQTREIGMEVWVLRTGDHLVVSGEKDLVMTDFGIEKPTAMWGMIKAYDDVSVRFKVGVRSTTGQDSTGGGE